jgi:aerobic-type carbon monoxide dehydrogenase small subunit (CoxS/CutS family)
VHLSFSVNDDEHDLEVEARELLLDVLRQRLGLSSVHAACEQGSCGTCTVLVDGSAVRSCLLFAVQLQGRQVRTIEGLVTDGELHPLQQAFSEHHALQCGFCTPAMVLSALELLERTPAPTRQEIEHALSGNICRCTGYISIVDAVEAAAASGSR